jgi:phage terminase small subunit
MARKITEKQKLWAQHYAVSFNATDAAIKAGYPAKSAGKIGHENLHSVRVKPYLEELLSVTRQELQITKEQIIGDLMTIKAKNIDNDPRVAIQALGEINRMLGYHAPTKTETKITTEQPLLPGIEDIKFIDVTNQKQIENE